MKNTKDIFIFVHIPKTAGVSFIKILREEFGPDNIFKIYNMEQRHKLQEIAGTTEANQFKAVIGHYPFGAHKFFKQTPIYVSLVREPVARYLSLFNWFVENRDAGPHQQAVDLGINDFFDHLIENVPGEQANAQCRYICGVPSFIRAKQTIENKYFAVGVTENFEDFCGFLTKELNWQNHVPVKMNVTSAKFCREDLTDETKRKIEAYHSEDLRLYNFIKEQKNSICKGSPRLENNIPVNYIRKSAISKEVLTLNNKVFNIGWQKTGTTSIHAAMEMLDLKVLADVAYYISWCNGQRTTKELIDVVDDYYSTKDYPWTLLYKELAAAYPDSKFILTLRDPQNWLESLRQHILRNPIQPAMNYIYGRYFNAKDFCIKDQELALAKYHQHNADVLDYFEGTDRLLVMDLKAGDGWSKLCPFLGIDDHPAMKEDFPVANKWKYQ